MAEKLETVISRNVTNTRMRDFYDIYILQKLHGEQLNKEILWNALVATARKRGTLEQIESGDIREILNEIETSSVMENLWKTYQKNYSYAIDISWHIGVCESFSVNRIFRSSMIKYKIIGGLILWQEKRNRYTKYK